MVNKGDYIIIENNQFKILSVTDKKAENSINQQKEYLKMADEINEKYNSIVVAKVENSKELEKTKEEFY